ncbi:P63C domain-containing protein [Rhizobium ruizarguesonis]
MADDEAGSPQSKGGKKRAENLSKVELSSIARQAASARWARYRVPDGEQPPKAIASGILPLGDIPCAVLDDDNNTRVLTQAGFLTAIGRFATPKSAGNDALANIPAFLRAKNLESFISSDLVRSSTPVVFQTEKGGGMGGTMALGYRAEVLPAVCWVYHEAERAGKLLTSQKHVADACTKLLKGLTNVAIDALVDEATGFQDKRARDALIRLLEQYVSRDALPWLKTFDDDFYKEMFRIHGYKYEPGSVKRPMIFAKRTEDIYNRLAPGIREELQKVVKRGKSGRPSQKLFQHLTQNEGYIALLQLLAGTKAVLRLSKSTEDYEQKMDQLFPRFGETMKLPFQSPFD